MKEMIYDIISWTGVWLASPAVSIGPFDAVVITIGHIFLLYFMVSTISILWLAYKLNCKGEV